MSALTDLAAFCGIEQKTTDAKGDTSPTSGETERAILQAMGIDAHGEDSAVAELKRLQAEQWALALPPVWRRSQGRSSPRRSRFDDAGLRPNPLDDPSRKR